MSALTPGTLLLVLPSLAVFCLVLLTTFSSGGATRLRKRAHEMKEVLRAAETPGTAAPRRIGRRDAKRIGLADRLASRYLPKQASLRERLAATGRQITPGSYLLVCLALSVVAALVIIVVSRQSLLVAAPAGAAAGFALPHLVVGFLVGRRRGRFVNQLPDAIDIIVRGVRAGLPVTESMAVVAREMGDPVGTEFRRTVDVYRLGRPLPEALAETARRIGVPEFDFLQVAMSIQQETGGNLGETLSNLADIIRKRRQMRLKIKALTGEARAGAWIVGALPFLLFGVINILNPGYTDILIEDPTGQRLLAGGLISMVIGALIMYRMSNFKI